jgi:nuclear pore complex protein Nup50
MKVPTTSFRCKLFYKKGAEFADKGLGMLHLKPVESTNKTQLLVRAETSLGNILLNVMLNNQVSWLGFWFMDYPQIL